CGTPADLPRARASLLVILLERLRVPVYDTQRLVIYMDGQRFGTHHILSAVGVDVEGKKHIMGIAAGATENAAAVKALLTRLRDQGLPTDRKYLFIIDGATGLRAAIAAVGGDDQPVQRGPDRQREPVIKELRK